MCLECMHLLRLWLRVKDKGYLYSDGINYFPFFTLLAHTLKYIGPKKGKINCFWCQQFILYYMILILWIDFVRWVYFRVSWMWNWFIFEYVRAKMNVKINFKTNRYKFSLEVKTNYKDKINYNQVTLIKINFMCQ